LSLSRLTSDHRVRRWAAEAAIVGAAALSAFAVAHASLPRSTVATQTLPAIRVTLPPTAAAPAAGVEDAALISFEEPVPGHAVVSPFGLRQLPWEGNGRLHEGVDISADAGVAVRVAADGVVVASGEKGGYGRYVAVRHAEGLTTIYAHLGRIGAGMRSGLAVAGGDELGRVGSTGTSTGPHLHFEIRDAEDRPLNPAMFLGKAFAEAGDLPLDKAKRYSGRVRMAVVSHIPASKRALMEAQARPAVAIVRRDTAKDLAMAERNLQGVAGSAAAMDGISGLAIGPDGRPRAQLNF
jgi:murein DD-endopeptidase MepM/ murein hydrolase activator NlpD